MGRAKGYIVLAAAVVMHTCLGGIYAWNIFDEALRASFHYSSMQTGLVFGSCILVFTLSVVFTGPLQDRFGPRRLSMAGGVVLAGAYLTAGFGGRHFPLLWLGMGLLQGLAIGLGYVCPIATAVKWFPRHKGLVSGLAVAGYGGSAILVSQIARWLYGQSWTTLEIFRTVGVVFGTVVVAMGALMFLPGPIPPKQDLAFRRRALLGDRRFWLLFAAFFCSGLAGLTVTGKVKSIGLSLGNAEAVATLAISVLAVGNASGRVLWGFIYDRLGGRRSVMLSLGAMAASALGVVLLGRVEEGFLLAAGAVGFCYGGNFAIYAPESARLYGVHIMGTVYPLLLVSHGLSAQIGPAVAGWMFGLSGSYVPGIVLGASAAGLGLAAFALGNRRESASVAA